MREGITKQTCLGCVGFGYYHLGFGGPPSLKKRSRVDIYADILEVLKRRPDGSLVTRVSYGAGLPLDRVKPMLETLANFGLLSIRMAGDSRFYHITRRGLEFLDAYRKVQGFMTYLGSDQR